MTKKTEAKKKASRVQKNRDKRERHGLRRLDVSVLPESIAEVKAIEDRDMIKSGYRSE